MTITNSVCQIQNFQKLFLQGNVSEKHEMKVKLLLPFGKSMI